jgi:hypothetical protein
MRPSVRPAPVCSSVRLTVRVNPCGQVRGYFTKKLIKVVGDVNRFINAGRGEPLNDFPMLAGSHLTPVGCPGP